MPSSFAVRAGLALRRTPNARHQATRRRLGIACAIAALALASGVLGALIGPTPGASQGDTGPFNYFPTQ